MTALSLVNSVSNTAVDESASLLRMLQTFNETTERLHRTHSSLQREVARLHEELADAHDRLDRSRALAELGEMAAGIAHEVRNPLGAIQLHVQLLEADLQEVPEQSAICTKIRNAVGQVDSIIRDVLSFAREARVHDEPVPVAELIESALGSVEPLLHEHEVVPEIELEPDVEVSVDQGLISVALANLLRNAIEAMAEAHVMEPSLRIEVRRGATRSADGRRSPRVIIAIEDNGPGVSPDAASRIFAPFFTTRSEGTGLGLAITHRIIDAHAGTLRVMTGQAGGARFELGLPPADGPAGDVMESTDRTFGSRGKT